MQTKQLRNQMDLLLKAMHVEAIGRDSNPKLIGTFGRSIDELIQDVESELMEARPADSNILRIRDTELNQNILHIAALDLVSFQKILDLLKTKDVALFNELIKQQDAHGNTIFHRLMKSNLLEQLNLLISAVFDKKDEETKNCMNTALLTNKDITGATEENVFTTKDEYNQNILNFTVTSVNNFKYLCEFLLNNNKSELLKKLITEQDSNGGTVLHKAMISGSAEVLNYLIDLARVNEDIGRALHDALFSLNKQNKTAYHLKSNADSDIIFLAQFHNVLYLSNLLEKNKDTLVYNLTSKQEGRVKAAKDFYLFKHDIYSQIDAMINTLKSESGTMSFGWNTDLKAKKIHGLNTLKQAIIVADTADAIKNHIIKQLSDPTMTQGRFSHRTRDLLEKLLVESHPKKDENLYLNIFKDKYGARIASMIAKLETEGASPIKIAKKQGLTNLLDALKVAASLDDASSAIDTALESPEITQGFFSHRTKDLLQQMQQDIQSIQRQYLNDANAQL